MDAVQALYDTHPINEGEVLAKLQAAGKDIEALRPQDLVAYDQDHYGALEATDALAERLGVEPGTRVLDVCAGLGGTSRYLAWKYGCTVRGVDRNAGRVAGARALNARVGLAERVEIVQGDATDLHPDGPPFDAALGQEAFIHIRDKPALLGGCRRMLRSGGRLAFTDIIAGTGLSDADRAQLAETLVMLSLITAGEYLGHLRAAGFSEVSWEDVSPWWSQILRGRLEMYRSLESETARRFGPERHARWIAAYTHFVECIESGRLGGGRFLAVN